MSMSPIESNHHHRPCSASKNVRLVLLLGFLPVLLWRKPECVAQPPATHTQGASSDKTPTQFVSTGLPVNLERHTDDLYAMSA